MNNKYDSENRPLVTIVTVVYNSRAYIESTIKNVLSQTYNNIEYIIVDGGSTDGTLELIELYANDVDIVISEPDSGIYDAMNKAIRNASGQWINFMNAGDLFFDANVLENVFGNAQYTNFDIVYGNHEVVYPNGSKKFRFAGDVVNLWKGSQFCHQSVFIRTEYHKKNIYKLTCKMAADFDFFYTANKSGASFKRMDLCICTYQAGGVSDIKRVDVILEFWRIIDKSFCRDLFYIGLILRERLKQVVKNVIR